MPGTETPATIQVVSDKGALRRAHGRFFRQSFGRAAEPGVPFLTNAE